MLAAASTIPTQTTARRIAPFRAGQTHKVQHLRSTQLRARKRFANLAGRMPGGEAIHLRYEGNNPSHHLSKIVMLASDLIMDVRASRAISADQVVQLERMIFAGGAPSAEQLDLLLLIDAYLERSDPCWAELLARAAQAAMGHADEEKPGGAGATAPALVDAA